MPSVRSYPDDFVPGPSSASRLNEGPWGCIAGETRSTNGDGTFTVEEIIAFSLTVPDGRRQRFMGGAMVVSDITGGVQIALYLNSVQQQRSSDSSLGAGKQLSLRLQVDKELDAGTYTVQLVVGVSGVAGNFVTSQADGPDGVLGMSYLYVDDVGPAWSA